MKGMFIDRYKVNRTSSIGIMFDTPIDQAYGAGTGNHVLLTSASSSWTSLYTSLFLGTKSTYEPAP